MIPKANKKKIARFLKEQRAVVRTGIKAMEIVEKKLFLFKAPTTNEDIVTASAVTMAKLALRQLYGRMP
jgi:hypothetical protein